MNKERHRLHRMPQKAAREQRIGWHVAHARACSCRAIAESIETGAGQLRARKR